MEVKGVQGVKILVGDDDRVNQLVISGMLKKLRPSSVRHES
jgi:hypothetical protein